MKKGYYIDTSIWMDLYENRKGYDNEPLGDFAYYLFSSIMRENDHIIISDVVIQELENYYTIEEINGMMKLFERAIEKCIAQTRQCDEARYLAEKRDVPRGDALHAILARDNHFILISRDNDFRKLDDVARHYKPEELI